MAVAIPIIVIIAVGIATVMVLANRRGRTTGELSRETRQRDASPDLDVISEATTSTDLETTGRERAQ